MRVTGRRRRRGRGRERDREEGRFRFKHHLAGAQDVFLPSHEDQDVACRLREVDLQRLLDGRLHVVLARLLGINDIHGESAARNPDDNVKGEGEGED